MPMNLAPGKAVSYAVRTDVGRIREHNEDSYNIDAEQGLFVLADGMGGHASGEVASEIAVTRIVQQVKQGSGLVEAIEDAHLAILNGVKTGLGRSGMGTTVVAVQLQDDVDSLAHGHNYSLAWVGDSRAYLWDGSLSQLSKDHSMVQMLIDTGQITADEARTHPRKNIIYQNLGSAELERPEVSIKQGILYKNQKIILCSDGLSDEVDEKQMSEIITMENNNDVLVEKLVAAAINNGGKDNVTVVVISASYDALEKPLVNE